jgi:elongation factor 2
MCERLWGDSFFIPSEKAWKRVADGQYRAFNLFILDPIGKIFSACMNNQMEKVGGSCGVSSVPRPCQSCACTHGA